MWMSSRLSAPKPVLVVVLGLGLIMMGLAPARPAFGRTTRTSPGSRATVKDPGKRGVTKRKTMRRDVRSARVAVSERPAHRSNRRIAARRLTRRPPVAVPPEPETTATSGWVNIESKPGIVHVYINGQSVGSTPLQIPLNEGRHTIEAIREDGVRQRRIIDIERGQQRYLVLVS